MCGLFGWIDKSNSSDAGQRRMLAWNSQSRGTHGVGMLGWHSTGPIAWKTSRSIVDYLKDPQEIHPFDRYDVVLGHNRRASSVLGAGSAVTLENTHPFQVGHITMAHNGIIDNRDEIKAELAKDPEYEELCSLMTVDSHILCAAINKWGPDALARVIGKAAVWYYDDRMPMTANIWIWNQDFAMAEYEGAAIFASELDNLKACGFYEGHKLKDEGQFLEIDIATASIVNKGDIKGNVRPVVVTPTNNPAPNYEWTVPNELREICKTKSEEEELSNAFGVMQGRYVGICSKCGEYVDHFACGIEIVDDSGESAKRGKQILYHKKYQHLGGDGCGGILHALTRDRCREYLAGHLKVWPEHEQFLEKYYRTTSPRRQMRINDAIDLLKKDGFEPPYWMFGDWSDALLSYPNDASWIRSALRKVPLAQVKAMWKDSTYDGIDEISAAAENEANFGVP